VRAAALTTLLLCCGTSASAAQQPGDATDAAIGAARLEWLERALRSDADDDVRRASDALVDLACELVAGAPPRPASSAVRAIVERWRSAVPPSFEVGELAAHLEVLFEDFDGDRLPDGSAELSERLARHASAEGCDPPLAAAVAVAARRALAAAGAAALAQPGLPVALDPDSAATELIDALSDPSKVRSRSDAALCAEWHAVVEGLPLATRLAAQAEWSGCAATEVTSTRIFWLLRAVDGALRCGHSSRHPPRTQGELLSIVAAEAAALADPLARGEALAVLVDAMLQRGDDAAAIAALDELTPLLAPGGGASDAARVRAGAALRLLGRWDECLALLEPLALRPGDDAVTARAAGEYGVACADLGMLDVAARSLGRELELARRLGGASEVAACYHAADLLERRRDLEEAAALLRRTLARGELFADVPRDRARLRIRLAHAEMLAEEATAGPVAARRSVATLREALADPRLLRPDAVDVHLLLALAALLDRDDARAAAELAVADAAIQSLPAADPGLTSRALRDTLAMELALRRHARGEPDAGVGATSLLVAREAGAATLARTIAQWRRVAPREGGIGFLGIASRRALLSALLALDQVVEPDGGTALERLDAIGALGSVVQRLAARNGAPDTAAWIARRREEGDVFVVVIPSWLGSRLLLIDAGSVEIHDLPGELRLAHHPARLLPRAVAQRLEGRPRVHLVASAPVASLPLEEGFAGVTAVSFLASLTVGAALADGATATHGLDAALLAVPELGSGGPAGSIPPPLPETLASTMRFGQHFGSTAHREVTGRAADRAALASLMRERPRLLHLFVHGAFDSERRRPGGLWLAGDRATGGAAAGGDLAGGEHAGSDIVWCDQLEAMGPTSIGSVILSSCGAARGPQRIGDDGTTDLGGALLAAGARSVLLSRADLPAAATAALMERVHASLAAGATPAEALAAARRAPGLAEVAASFRVVGLGHEAPFPGGLAPAGRAGLAAPAALAFPGGRGGAVALGALVLSAAAFVVRRRRAARADRSRSE
jgi:tetratricopeptide (TPR) repeat protein